MLKMKNDMKCFFKGAYFECLSEGYGSPAITCLTAHLSGYFQPNGSTHAFIYIGGERVCSSTLAQGHAFVYILGLLLFSQAKTKSRSSGSLAGSRLFRDVMNG